MEKEKTNEYQKTLNLPVTDFAMKAGLTQKEPAFLEKWAKEGLYKKIREQSRGRKKYILHDGPPYANGNIHIGHALNKILKDMIVKFKTMEGFDSLYVPGWDCHGLPIEHQLLKELKQNKSQVDCVDFRKKAHDYAMKYVGIQRDQFKRLGVFGQWDEPYLTLSPDYEYWILRSLGTLHQKGFIYRGLKPVNWCASCETALAEAEVEYENHMSPTVYVNFSVNNAEVLGLPKDKKVSLLVWTTTPWTLLANVAVAANEEYSYSCIEVDGEILILEEGRVDIVLATSLRKESFVSQRIKTVKGKDLTKLVYTHVFNKKQNCPVVNADYVSKEDGTGLVHIAPGHGQEDYQVGINYKLDVLMPVNDKGVFTEDGAPFAGQFVFKANPLIIEDLKKRNLLFANLEVQHTYPHCWRCKNPIIFRATKQWFLRIDHDDLREKLIKAIKNDVRWVPPSGEERILGMVSTRPDWCLSRQRFWGVPIPALACKNCGEHTLFKEVIEGFAAIVKKEGSDCWFTKRIEDFVSSKLKCPKCGKNEFDKSQDILDVWFDSGVSHQAVVKAMLKEELPVDLYLEGSDQHRGWFQSSLIPGMAIEGQAPFKGILTHGFVVDGSGRKMSKSLGNVISPLDIMKNNGADILRLWVASSDYNEDIRISPEILDRLVDAYRKIRNTIRYILGNLHGFVPKQDMVEYKNMLELDRWALNRLVSTVNEIKLSYDNFEFARVYKLIYAFCNEDLSSFYLDILKDRLYTCPAKSPERRSAQTVLYHSLNHLMVMTAPILSFTAEEVFFALPQEIRFQSVDSVHLLRWPQVPQEWNNPGLEEEFKVLIALRPHVLKALEEKRRGGQIGSSLEAKILFQTVSDRDHEYLMRKKDILASVFIVSEVDIEKAPHVTDSIGGEFPKTSITVLNAEGHKCSRCWNYKTDVGQDSEHPSLCIRCATIVKEF